MPTPMTPHTLRQLTTGALALAAGLALAACSDAPTAPSAPSLIPITAAPSTAVSTSTKTAYNITTVGDTSIATITLAPGGQKGVYAIGAGQHLDIPGGAEVVCDLATSTYGVGTWDSPCTPSKVKVTITARTWVDANGFSHAEFSPALRFVPDKDIDLYMNSKTGVDASRQQIKYCTPTFGCIDEALTDPSVRTLVVSKNQLERRVKHFSGYNVVVD